MPKRIFGIPEDDDGVPPCCRNALCPLDHRNKIFNDNEYIRRLGNVGYPFFDRHRITLFSIAAIVTIFAMILVSLTL